MIPKQSRERNKRPVNTSKKQMELDSEFDQGLDNEVNLHAPQANDYLTMDFLSQESGTEPEGGLGKKSPSKDEITVDDISYMLSRHPEIDASDVIIHVTKGEVTLTGSVPEERTKFVVAEVVKLIHGVKSVNNQLKVAKFQ